MIARHSIWALTTLVLWFVTEDWCGANQAEVINVAADACKALEHDDFSGVTDALTQVLEAKDVRAGSQGASYCEVSGYVAPSTGFVIRMPLTTWNGKFIELGCGGVCGTSDATGCDEPLRRGYACIVSDGGHRGKSTRDVTWARNNDHAIWDYIVRAPHVTALAGKAIAQHFYQREISKSYFMGCSAGGIQGMSEAERFPSDFDGIVAGDPAIHTSGLFLGLVWGNRAITNKAGDPLFQKEQLKLLHGAVVAKCDLNDGVRDGLIGDPRTCKFDASELLCSANRTARCLTAEQITAAKKIYGGPVSSTGYHIAPPSALMGSELTWLDWFAGSAAHPTSTYTYAQDVFRYAGFLLIPGALWKPEDFDFDRDYKRFGMSETWEPINPDLRRFKAAGGKLLSYTGWSDAAEGVLRTVDFYETAERIMGGRSATQDFFRLFVIPGMYHCGGGDGAWDIDYLAYLDNWVERGAAPEKLIGAHPKSDQDLELVEPRLDPSAVSFTRPIFPYPLSAKYRGSGDPSKAESFKAVGP